MVIIGVDSHKRTHTVVAVDETGRKLGEKTAPAGDTKTEAYRALRRRLSDEVYRRMRDDDGLQVTARASLAAAA